MFDTIKECFIIRSPQQKSGNKINFYRGNKMNTLFSQLSELEQETVAMLCGFQMCTGFKNTLYDMPAMEGNMGQIAKAVLKHRLAHLNKITKKTK
jgi:hypothetical protein